MGSIFEICMLVCFGSSWPVSIHKSWTSRTAKGKSLLFTCLLFFGYVFGILHKIFYMRDFVIALYALNLVLISIDICLYFRNRKLDAARDKYEKQT